MSVAHKQDTPLTASSAYSTWRFSLDYRYGMCPSLQEAFEAGWRACPTSEAGTWSRAYREGRALGHDEGYAVGLKEGASATTLNRVTLPQRLAGLGWGAVRLSVREAEVLVSIADGPDGCLDAKVLATQVWGAANPSTLSSVRTLVQRVRSRAPSGICIGTIYQSTYRYHVIADSDPCPKWRHVGGGSEYTPACRKGQS